MDCDGGFCRRFRCEAGAGTGEARDFCQTTTFIDGRNRHGSCNSSAADSTQSCLDSAGNA